MYLPYLLIVIASILVILLWVCEFSLYPHGRVSLPALVMAMWLISSAALGPYFFVLRIPGGFDLTLERFFFILMLFLFVIGLFSGKVHFRDDVGIEILMGLFIIICFFSMIRTGFSPSSPNYPSPWFILITGYLFPFIAFVYAKYLLIDDTDPLVIFNTLFFLGIYLCIIAFFEYFNLRQFIFPRFIANPNIGIHFDRARGPFLNAAVNGAGILAGFVCGLFLIGKKIGMSKVLYFSLLLLFFPAVFFTQTRSVYLGLIIVLFLFAGWYKTAFPKWKLLSLPLAILLIVAMANSHRFFSADRREGGVYQLSEVQSRIALFERSLAMIAERPFLGVGWAQFIPASNKIYKGRIPFIAESDMELLQHNHLLGLAVELGIGGVSVYIMIIIMVFRRLMQLSGRWTQNGIMGDNLQIVIVMIWCVYLCNNFFIEPSNNLFLNAVPFVFAGLADGLYRRSLKLERKFSATSMESHAHV